MKDASPTSCIIPMGKQTEPNFTEDLLCHILWHCAFLDDDIDNNWPWTAWSDLLFTAIDQCIPKRITEKICKTPRPLDNNRFNQAL